MKAEIEVEFRGKWINLPVEFEYSLSHGTAVVDVVTFNHQDILPILEEGEILYLNILANKRESYRRHGHQLRMSEIAAEEQEKALSDPLKMNRRAG